MNQWPNSQSFSFVSIFCHWPAASTNIMSSVGIGSKFFLRTILAKELFVNTGAVST